jgi:hypothetical protein
MRTRWIIAAILILVGLVWIGQGLGIIRSSSFMTDDLRWTVIGAGTATVGILVAATAITRGPAS